MVFTCQTGGFGVHTSFLPGELLDNGNIKIFPFDTTHRRFNRHTLVNLELCASKGSACRAMVSMSSSKINTFRVLENVPISSAILSDFLSHRSPSNFRHRD